MLDKWLHSDFARLAQAYRQGSIPSSVILRADQGQGGLELALEFAKLYLCLEHRQEPCCQCRSCTFFAKSTHPDFKAVLQSSIDHFDQGLDLSNDLEHIQAVASSDNKFDIRIDSIRKLSHYLHESAMVSKRKVSIIANAHRMNELTANALLKLFEEPPAHTLIIMVTDSFEKLLPTLLSRALKLSLSKVSAADMKSFVSDYYGFDYERAKAAIALYENAPYKVLDLLNAKVDEFFITFKQKLCKFISLNNAVSCYELCQAYMAIDPVYRVVYLRQLLLQILKYKAHFPLDNLLLLDEQSAATLCKISSLKLFALLDELKNLVPSKGPSLKTEETCFRALIVGLTSDH